MGLPGNLLQFPKDPGPDPLAASFPDRGGRAGAVGGRCMLAAKPQDLMSFPTMIHACGIPADATGH
jgi:hypothetical protein